jgi:hypothetical protein
MHFGDGMARTEVIVYEPIRSFEDMRHGQHFVIAPVRLTRSDTIRWPLPLGLFQLHYRRTSDAQPIPSLAVRGPIVCMPDFAPTVEFVNCLARGPGAVLRMTHPGGNAPDVAGALALEWRRYR